jgi:hypothetical protein
LNDRAFCRSIVLSLALGASRTPSEVLLGIVPCTSSFLACFVAERATTSDIGLVLVLTVEWPSPFPILSAMVLLVRSDWSMFATVKENRLQDLSYEHRCCWNSGTASQSV